MFGKKESSFCPIIKDNCKKAGCKFWRMDDCSLAVFFETQGVTFFNQLAELDEIEKNKENEKSTDYSWLEKTSEEKIINEMIEYSLKEFPDEKYLSYSFKNIFWQSKGLGDKYNFPTDIKIKIEKVESKADNLFQKKIEEQEKEKIEDTIENCFNWAKKYNSTKLTKSDVNAYLLEIGKSFSTTSKDIIYSKVNMKLKNPKSLDEFNKL